MSLICKLGGAILVAVALAAVALGFARERLPGQIYNRMVCVKTQGKDAVYVDMPSHFDLGSPSISPDDKSIAFDALTIGVLPVRETWLVGIDGRGLHKLADGATPRWSPDGKRLMVTRGYGDPAPTLVEIEVATGKERTLCGGCFGDWSPDGSRIAFSRGGTPPFQHGLRPGSKLFIAKADGSDPREVGDGDRPSWSPDGKKLALFVDAGKRRTFYVLDLETKHRSELGQGFYRAEWAGDGRSVVSNGTDGVAPSGEFRRSPARFWLARPGKPQYFFTDMDNPWSPCISRDGKTIALIVDSPTRKKPPRDAQEEEEK